jgi:CheY-like chemotaxis protein
MTRVPTSINVLIVDDDETDRYITQRVLSRSDKIGNVAEVADGSEAYELFSTGFDEFGPHPPRTLVLLDINMPLMSGFDLLQRLEADHLVSTAEVSVIAMLTSSSYSGDRAKAESFSLVDGYIEKPLTHEVLEELVDRCFPDGVRSQDATA